MAKWHIWLAAALALTAAPASAQPAPADLVITGAHIKTMDPAQPLAQAVAVRGGRIIAVGSNAAVTAFAGPATQRIDAAGKTLLPGFIDTHMHPRPAIDEMSPYGTLDMSAEGGVHDRAQFNAKLKAKAALLPAGALIIGRGYGDDLIGGHPTRAELDAVVPDHPVMIVHSSGHRLVANSAAFAAAGITAATKDPDGGQLERDASGAFSGRVLETAQRLFGEVKGSGPSPRAIPPEVEEAGYVQEFRNFLSYGITGIADAGISPDKAVMYRRLLGKGLPVSIYAMLLADHVDWLLANRAKPEWQVPGLTLRTVKIFAGNSLSGHTALLYGPYADDPRYFGLEPKVQPAVLNPLIRKLQAAGLQAAVHANGDKEIDRVLDAFAAAARDVPRADTRMRVEHASITNPSIIARAKALDACFAPHSYILNHGAKLDAYGEKRFDWIEPNRHALDAGICIGGTSDHPVSPPVVLERIQSLVTRTAASNGRVYGASQRLTPDEALRAFTMGSAYLQFEEKERGSISVGKRADMVMLAADPAAVPPDQIARIAVLATYVAGKPVYELVEGKPRFAW
ncbi:MAG: amidohydrolase [Sphingomonadales bacterium]|jgi:predicted amidohydrolase YtcJ